VTDDEDTDPARKREARRRIGAFGDFDWARGRPVGAGLLLIPAMLAQATVGFVWLPLVRRRLGEFGLGKRRHRDRPR
jgi:hypothetical protein